MRARATAVLVLGIPALIALPALGEAHSPTVTRGVLRGSVSSADMEGRAGAMEKRLETPALKRLPGV